MTQTVPFPGVPCVAGKVFAGVVVPAGEDTGARVDAVTGAFWVGGAGCGGAGGGGIAAVAAELPTVTIGLIFPIVDADTPAFDKSFTEEYGRPAIIFFAVASPTPGKSFSSAALALFRSTDPPGALDAVALGAAGFVAVVDLLFAALTGIEAEDPKETSGAIFFIVAAETPAFDKSSAEE